MMSVDFFSVVILGMMVGIFHAFDADHVVAMATLVNQKSKKKQVLKYAIKWGGGHGGVLLLLGCLLAFVGIELPVWFVHYSEIMVGVLLIYLGSRLWLYLKNNAQPVQQHTTNRLAEKEQRHDHAPLFIGMLHGVAGSAPVLALLPNMLESQFLLHIGLFSLGCLLGMFCFGIALGSFQTYVKHVNNSVATVFARLLSISSISLGTYWIFS
jgi:putative flippase GtrA